MLERFSGDDEWLRLEEEWKQGKIGSRECLDSQMRGIRLTRKRLDKYLSTIKIDPSFKKILKLCKAASIKSVILSDNFDYILKTILKNNNIDDIDVYCNSVGFTENGLIPKFPHRGRCDRQCAHCKTKNLNKVLKRNGISAYVGDGLSDLCPSKSADLVFAKSTLKKRLTAEKIPHIPFTDLGDVYEYFKRRVA